MNKLIMAGGSQYYKSVNPLNEDVSGVWSPDPDSLKKQATSSRLVPSVFAGVQARIQAMADLPFCIYGKGDKEIDNSDDYKNEIGIMPNPFNFLAMAEGSLVNAGKAYWFKGKGARTGAVKEFQYWKPDSVKEEIAKDRSIKFKRQGIDSAPFSSDSVLYMWLPDSGVELGPPTVWPFLSAMIAAEANGAITTWVRDYMQRGAIKAMLLGIEGVPPVGEVERIETWWNKFMTGTKGLMWRVFNFSAIHPTIVGDGLEALKDLSINKELRYEIHTALGTRHLLEDENFATASARERQFYTQIIVPDARVIQGSLNEQVLEPMGYHIEFEPERLEIFQEDETKKTAALVDLFGVFKEAMSPSIALQLAAEVLDVDFTEEQMSLIEQGVAEKKQKEADLAAQMQKQNEQKPPEQQPQEQAQTPPQPKAIVELDKWQKKVEKAGKMVTWHAVNLPADIVKSITDGVLSFDDARLQLAGYEPEETSNKEEIKALALSIENAVRAYKEVR